MQPKTLALMMTLGLAGTAISFVPAASAHTCYSLIPSDCGPCTSGTHYHTYCQSWGDSGGCGAVTTDVGATRTSSASSVQKQIEIICLA
jgi:hypothetical protein